VVLMTPEMFWLMGSRLDGRLLGVNLVGGRVEEEGGFDGVRVAYTSRIMLFR